jgi:hypothetical protein
MFRIAMVKEAILTWGELYFVVIICLKNQLRWHFFIQQEKKEKKEEDYIWGFLVWHHEHS